MGKKSVCVFVLVSDIVLKMGWIKKKVESEENLKPR